MFILIVIMKIFLILNSLFFIYLLFLVLFGLKVKNVPISLKNNRFAILVPAYNEQENIGVFLGSLNKLDYPKELYDCFFVADHCSDNTAILVREKGIVCYEKNPGPEGKANAVAWLISQVLQEEKDKYDAFVFFDADNSVDSCFLSVINNSLNSGNKIIQGNTLILNWKSSLFSMINALNFIITNRFKENSRSNLGLSCRLRGHGMCFEKQELQKYNWAVDSMVEDQEIFLQVILKGRKVAWEHNAKVYSRMPDNISASRKQRIRWAAGKNRLLKKKSLAILANLKKDFSFIKLDALVDLLMPSYAVLVGASIISFVISILFFRGDSLVILWASLLLIGYFAYFILGSILEKLPLSVYLSFIFAPVFIFWRMWIYLISFKKMKRQQWR